MPNISTYKLKNSYALSESLPKVLWVQNVVWLPLWRWHLTCLQKKPTGIPKREIKTSRNQVMLLLLIVQINQSIVNWPAEWLCRKQQEGKLFVTQLQHPLLHGKTKSKGSQVQMGKNCGWRKKAFNMRDSCSVLPLEEQRICRDTQTWVKPPQGFSSSNGATRGKQAQLSSLWLHFCRAGSRPLPSTGWCASRSPRAEGCRGGRVWNQWCHWFVLDRLVFW